MAKRFTPAQRQTQIKQVNVLRKLGMSTTAACKKAKVNLHNYNYWLQSTKKSQGSKSVLKAARVPVVKTSMKAFNVNLTGGKNHPLIIAIGNPKDVKAALSNLATMFGGMAG